MQLMLELVVLLAVLFLPLELFAVVMVPVLMVLLDLLQLATALLVGVCLIVVLNVLHLLLQLSSAQDMVPATHQL